MSNPFGPPPANLTPVTVVMRGGETFVVYVSPGDEFKLAEIIVQANQKPSLDFDSFLKGRHDAYRAGELVGRSRKRRMRETHLTWDKWHKEGLSYQQIATKHHDETGEVVSRDAVIKAIGRLNEQSHPS